MKKYKVSWGSGFWFANVRTIEVEDFETESDVIDRLIDELDDGRHEGLFFSEAELEENGGDHYDDEYIRGGNAGRPFIHYGSLDIEEVKESGFDKS